MPTRSIEEICWHKPRTGTCEHQPKLNPSIGGHYTTLASVVVPKVNGACSESNGWPASLGPVDLPPVGDERPEAASRSLRGSLTSSHHVGTGAVAVRTLGACTRRQGLRRTPAYPGSLATFCVVIGGTAGVIVLRPASGVKVPFGGQRRATPTLYYGGRNPPTRQLMGCYAERLFAGADYALVWPPPLVRAELELLLATWSSSTHWANRAALLLEEAFAESLPASELRDAGRDDLSDFLTYEGKGRPEQRAYLKELARVLDDLPLAVPRQPLWSERQRQRKPVERLSSEDVPRQFSEMVHDLASRGYLDKLPHACRNGRAAATRTNRDLRQLVGFPDTGDIWPLRETHEEWSHTQLLDLIEAFHDVVARPRLRLTASERGSRYGDFAIEPGRRLYRWQVNALLGRSTVTFRLAEEGEDVGRLVATTDAARAELVSTMLGPGETTGGRVPHALALFRDRGATEHNKRSAIVALAGVLEERRAVLKEHLYQKDEGALFTIANEFALRHQAESQKADYDPVFLDWVFWWYLATIELSDRLLARQIGS